MIVYLRAGVYAEGPTDYHFLRPFLDRYLANLAANLFPGNHEVGDTDGIDAPIGKRASRAESIAAAIAAHADTCNLFIIHSDGAGDPSGAREANIEPGIALARATLQGREISAVACVPAREIEAWLLTDQGAFRALVGSTFDVALPAAPEKELAPKRRVPCANASHGSCHTTDARKPGQFVGPRALHQPPRGPGSDPSVHGG
jgi:hypothetical protein